MPFYMTSVWFGEDQRTNTLKTDFQMQIGLHLEKILTTPHPLMNTSWGHYAFNYEINKHALWITITKLG